MTSAIDPNKPADGVPAVKADLRANLATAKTELEHGGFVLGFTPASYGPPASTRVGDHLSAIDAALGLGRGGAPAFTQLTDTPPTYAGHAGKFVKVKSAADGLEFVTSSATANADAVDYSPAHAGAVSRSVESRLMEVLSVKDFGAVGDGTADDTAAIQAALDATRPSGDIVVFPPGIYRITSTLQIKRLDDVSSGGSGSTYRLRPLTLAGVAGGNSNSTPAGNGGGTSVILVDFNGIGLDLMCASDDASETAHFYGRIVGLSFHKNGAKEGSTGIRGYSVVNARFESFQVRGFATGAKIGDETISGGANGGGWYSTWHKVQFFNNTLGAWFAAMMHGARFVDCNFSAGTDGAKFGHDSPFHRSGTPLVLEKCYIEGNSGYGIQIHGGEAASFDGCYFEFNEGPFIDFRAGSDAQGALIVRGCHMLRNSNGQYINVVAANSAATVTVILIGSDFQRGGSSVESGLVAVNIDANPSRIAIMDHGSINFKVLAGDGSGRSPVALTNQPLANLRAYDCACSQLYANQTDGLLNGRS